MRPRFFFLLIALFSICQAARADFIYTYVVHSPNPVTPIVGTYVFEEPSLLTSLTFIDPSSFLSSTGTPLLALYINPVADFCPSDLGAPLSGACIQTESAHAEFTEGFIAPFTSVGPYFGSHLPVPPDSLTISQTPEPSTFVLLGTAFLGILAFTRRNRLTVDISK